MNPECCIDTAWCDVRGVYLRGWAHWGDQPFETLTLCCAGRRQEVALFDRPDVLAAFPAAPAGQRTGFAGYLACPPFQPVTLELRHGDRRVEIPVSISPETQPRPEPWMDQPAPIDAFAQAMRARHGAVIEIGARAVGAYSALNAQRFMPECRFIGCDIHAAPGVDLVADAHFLSRSVEPGTIDGVFSLAVLEHLAAPWMVAAEINRVLRIGGETLHLAPHAWPVHEQPNDFGPATGFEVLDAAMSCPVQIVPPENLRDSAFVELPLTYAYTASFIWARKVADLDEGAVRWPMALGESETRSRAYPVR
jgi:SAM-dependent methyltransferase